MSSMFQDDDEENEDSLDEEVLEEEGILDEDEIEQDLTCDIIENDDMDSVIWKVAEALRDSGMGWKASEFEERARRCTSYEEVIELAKKYVKVL